jgi:hypothetical protein
LLRLDLGQCPIGARHGRVIRDSFARVGAVERGCRSEILGPRTSPHGVRGIEWFQWRSLLNVE